MKRSERIIVIITVIGILSLIGAFTLILANVFPISF